MRNKFDDCVFCKIVRGEIPSHKIWEDKEHVAILSIFPNTEGFTVVLTKKHYPSYVFENNDKVICKLMLATKNTAKVLDAYFKDVGRCGIFFEGFGVNHLHSKIFPMHGTADIRIWKPIESRRKMHYKKYPGYLSSHDAGRADDGKLSELARKIRTKAGKLKL